MELSLKNDLLSVKDASIVSLTAELKSLTTQSGQKVRKTLSTVIVHTWASFSEQLSISDDVIWEIERQQIKLECMKTVWHYGEVWEGIWNQQPIVVRTGAMEAEKKLPAQANVMKKLNHNNLVQLYGLCTKEEPILIITELLRFGCLSDYLRGEGRALKVPALINMATQIASGMAYIEGKGYIHLHLAARKVFVGEGSVCKVAVLGDVVTANNENGTYVASERFNFYLKWTAHDAAMSNCFSIKSSVWSFGILLYEVITYGQLPYPGMNNEEALKKSITGLPHTPPVWLFY